MRRTITAPTGLAAVSTRELSGRATVVSPDSTLISTRTAGDPRFGLNTPLVASFTITTPGALTLARQASTGLLAGTTLGGVTTSLGYSPFGELGAQTVVFGGTDTLYRAVYTRDPSGRITRKVETVEGVTDTLDYAYDAVGRLEEVQQNGQVVESYTYDANGNRLAATYPSGTVAGMYDDQDRLLTYGGASYSYTAAGELAMKVEGADTTRYTYDELGNLVEVVLPDGTVIEYVIDGQNRRVGKKVNGALAQAWLYGDQLNPVAELDSTGAVVARFVYGSRPNVPEYMVKGGVTYRIVADHLGSMRLAVDVATGQVAQRIDYDAFGQVAQNTSPGFQPFGFAGGIDDGDVGLARFGFRDYAPTSGRWTLRDAALFRGGSPNLYQYVLNNPVNAIDPAGTCPRAPDGWICIALSIQAPKAPMFPLKGDARDFSTDSDPSQSRMWIHVDPTTGDWNYRVNDSCRTDTGACNPPHEDNWVEVICNPDGTIDVIFGISSVRLSRGTDGATRCCIEVHVPVPAETI